MRRIYFVLIAVICCTIYVLLPGCQEQTPQPTVEKKLEPQPKQIVSETTPNQQTIENGPKLTFEKVVHNFGDITPKSRNKCKFKFTNTGKSALKIGKIKAACGCTVPKMNKKVYAPGESGFINITYKAGSSPAKASKNLTVPSNDPENSKIALTIKANIVSKIAYLPKKLNLKLNKENAGCPDITITSLDGQEFSITSFKSKPDCITAEFDPNSKSTKFILKPNVDIDELNQRLRGNIAITLTHPQAKKINIPFITTARFKGDPSRIYIRSAEPLNSVTKTLWMLSNYDEDFDIAQTSSAKGMIKVLNMEKVGNRYKFELEITPPEKTNRRYFTDTFEVTTTKGDKLRVNCQGFYPRKNKKQTKQTEPTPRQMPAPQTDPAGGLAPPQL
ncbi:DUF1573 domain-containing protein [Planctomycetota bacterium]